MKYVYGPVPSRRLGSSLGVNLIPFKTCSYSCVYCQLGKTTCKTVERKSYFPKEEVLEEVEKALSLSNPDYVTFAGEGEPTLSLDLGWMIERVSKNARVAVITNSSLLWREDVREELLNSNACLPSLDAATERTFRRVNRPHKSLTIEKIIEGLLEFGDDYDGTLMLEIMLVKDYNDSREELEAIAGVVSELKPDAVHVLTPVRPPASNVEPANAESIMLAVEILEKAGVNPEAVVFPETGKFDFSVFSKVEDAIRVMSRHPMREDQLEELAEHFEVEIDRLKELLEEREFGGNRYYIFRGK